MSKTRYRNQIDDINYIVSISIHLYQQLDRIDIECPLPITAVVKEFHFLRLFPLLTSIHGKMQLIRIEIGVDTYHHSCIGFKTIIICV